MKRSTKAVLVGVTVLAAGAGGVAYAANRSTHTATADKPAPKVTTVKITKRDLVTYNTTTATLGYTTSVTVPAPVEGTVTSILKSGDTVDAGTVVASIDGTPVVALLGDVPAYRDLSTASTAGIDVLQLKQNLIRLGFDYEGTMTMDETYDTATADAVDRWEASLGLTQDGKVPQSRMVFIPGKLLVDTVSAAVGARTSAGTTLLTARQVEREHLVSGTVGDGGTVNHFAAAGTPITTGTVLFWENSLPVVAIVGDEAALPMLARDLYVGVADGADVKLLEQMLVDGGFDPDHGIVVDDHFDQADAYAVYRWQQQLGVPMSLADVVVHAGSFVVVPAGLTAGRSLVPDDGILPTQAPAFTLTTLARDVTTNAPLGDATFAQGAKISVLFPDNSTTTGTVIAVGTVATASSNTPGSTPNVPITIEVDHIPSAYDSFVSIPVTLQAVSDSAPGAFVVPASALVALAEGGYALNVVDGTNPDGTYATHLIGVTTGLFADGFVAVTGAKVAEGLEVVVPS